MVLFITPTPSVPSIMSSLPFSLTPPTPTKVILLNALTENPSLDLALWEFMWILRQLLIVYLETEKGVHSGGAL